MEFVTSSAMNEDLGNSIKILTHIFGYIWSRMEHIKYYSLD
jgi:hypothetical protein